jgi:hypothetical protein
MLKNSASPEKTNWLGWSEESLAPKVNDVTGDPSVAESRLIDGPHSNTAFAPATYCR